MIVDFQHHFTPRELIKEDPGDRLILHYDAQGAPSYTIHKLLYDLDEHVRMMEEAGIDAAWLTSAAGMCADHETSRFVNDKAKQAEREYPGRFIGAAHTHPLGGADAMKELNRCKHELGFQGVVITSETDGLFLDNPAFEPFWAEAARLGLFVFVHPALRLNYSQQFDGFDTARSVGREFSLIMATIRLINSGVFDRYPELTVHMAHLSGGVASMLGRIRSYQDKDFWGTKDNKRHGATAQRDFVGEDGARGNPCLSHRIRHGLSAGDPRPRSGARFRVRYPRARPRRRNDPLGQCREALDGIVARIGAALKA
jgi:predicted TIM-barrel fold metal-dependent hydrolase